MARKLEDFIASLPETEQHAIQQETERLIAEEMTLRALRQVRARSQEEIGHSLHIKQAAVSRLERRTDMYVSTLRSFIEAMGGKLDIIACFPDHAPVRINQFEKLGEAMPLDPLPGLSIPVERVIEAMTIGDRPSPYDSPRAPGNVRPRRSRLRAAHKSRQTDTTAPRDEVPVS